MSVTGISMNKGFLKAHLCVFFIWRETKVYIELKRLNLLINDILRKVVGCFSQLLFEIDFVR